MKNKINLKWAKHEDFTKFNYGDDLNPYIIKLLTGLDINYIHFANTRFNILKQFILGGFKTSSSINWYISNFIKSFFAQNYIIAIGSILQWYGSSRCTVWGSGIISKTDFIKPSNFLAVRGYHTKKRLEDLGYNSNIPLGDPALLLPLVYSPNKEKKNTLGIIPHISHYNAINEIFLKQHHKNVLVINLNNPNIESITDDIFSCEKIISTSLHGLIVSHAYGIKALWFKLENLSGIGGDNIKFYDYFSSVGISDYKPITFDSAENIIIDKVLNSFADNISLPSIDIKQIQQNLLEVAPFPIKKEFINNNT